ncbi:metallo-beta-lactamase superfamily protein [Fulvimarina pelagi HTCC2506]|uniref:Metallo-beta-lactamase superfamily protein n=1 Tax=Fulvimarina pelagi HTCC2506 TaxID=314231 RepID=Q0G5J0_9HYPH|nr:MBL fold metallo-hydrolase [Fulvimarina pelagi]EAU43074.1 metallo-beta-lactamase superfamily protein [Fulvimarina pelagi HTCC2506]
MTDRQSERMTRRQALAAGSALGLAATGMVGGARAQDGNPAENTEVEADISRAQTMKPGWTRFDLGYARITTVLDGERPGEGPFPTFGMEQSQEAMAELMRANFLPEERIISYFTPVLVELDDNLVLFDTGFGEGGRENGFGKLVERMEAAGYGTDSVTIVVLTHFHGDHIQGLVTADGSPVFPNARYVAGRAEWDYWTSDEAKSGPRADNAELVAKLLVPLEDQFTFVNDGEEVVTGITAIAAFGHTPGHMIFEIESEGQRLMLTADTANHFVASLQKPEWHVKFDLDKEQAVETRKRVFDRIAEERLPFIGYHMPFPAVGYAEKMEDGGYRFVPASYQFEVAAETEEGAQ